MHDLINIVVNIAADLGYTGIFIMMVLESSFIPFPSEVAMIPAGYLASIGRMDFSIALLVGTFGALVGSTINYMLGYYLGEKAIHKLINKYGKYFLITIQHYNATEKYFEKHGSITTFLARFITVVRQLISLPAGVFKMNFAKFFFYTGLGAGGWNLILMIVGYIAGENKELIAKYSFEILIFSIFIILIIANIYYYLHKKKYAKL
ncbi:MAG: DedA family protein [Candidatus Gracilibacteria bacterium]|nr:DedA family protein [Candidatus Gracilibacteria bacterium]